MKIGIINQKTLGFSSSQAKSSQAQPTLGNNKSGYASNIAFKAAGLSLAEDVLLKNKIKATTIAIISDIDGTWKDANPELAVYANILDNSVRQIKINCAKVGINVLHGHITARPDMRVLKEGLWRSDYTFTDNGAIIHKGSPRRIHAKSLKWANILDKSNFNNNKFFELSHELGLDPKYKNMEIKTVGAVVNNPAADACQYISTLCISNNTIKLDSLNGETEELFDKAHYKTPSQVQEFMNDLKSKMNDIGMKAEMSPAYLFSGKPYVMFDTAAEKANKGDAVDVFTKYLSPKNIIVAGDGGNDIVMMKNDGRSVVVVGNDKKLRESVSSLDKDLVVIEDNPEKSCSMNLLSGLIKIIKIKSHELLERGLIKAEPDLDNISLKPRDNAGEDSVFEDYLDFNLKNKGEFETLFPDLFDKDPSHIKIVDPDFDLPELKTIVKPDSIGFSWGRDSVLFNRGVLPWDKTD